MTYFPAVKTLYFAELALLPTFLSLP